MRIWQSCETVPLLVVSHLPSEMKTMSMGGVSKNVMGLVLSIRIIEEASTAQLNNKHTEHENIHDSTEATQRIVRWSIAYTEEKNYEIPGFFFYQTFLRLGLGKLFPARESDIIGKWHPGWGQEIAQPLFTEKSLERLPAEQ